MENKELFIRILHLIRPLIVGVNESYKGQKYAIVGICSALNHLRLDGEISEIEFGDFYDYLLSKCPVTTIAYSISGEEIEVYASIYQGQHYWFKDWEERVEFIDKLIKELQE